VTLKQKYSILKTQQYFPAFARADYSSCSYKRSARSGSLYFLDCFSASISPLIVCHSTTSNPQQNYQYQCLSQHRPNCRQSPFLTPTPPWLHLSKISSFGLHSLSCPPSSRSVFEIQTALPLTRNPPQYRIPRSKEHRRKFSRTSCDSFSSIEFILEQEVVSLSISILGCDVPL